MLPAEHRLRSSLDFAHVLRRGRRAGRPTMVVHLAARTAPASPALTALCLDDVPPNAVPRVGLVVGRSVGNSVVRHQVSRRLRAQLATRLHRLPSDTDVVVRAQPPAAGADSRVLGADLDRALDRLLPLRGSAR